MKGRANRRFQNFKALCRARKITKRWVSGEEDVERIAQRIKNNRHPCSCPMCRNPRTDKTAKSDTRLTMQEKRANLGDGELL